MFIPLLMMLVSWENETFCQVYKTERVTIRTVNFARCLEIGKDYDK